MTGTVSVHVDYCLPTMTTHTVEYNCYHLKVDGKPIRGANEEGIMQWDNWMDERHERVCKALKELDEALADLIKTEVRP